MSEDCHPCGKKIVTSLDRNEISWYTLALGLSYRFTKRKSKCLFIRLLKRFKSWFQCVDLWDFWFHQARIRAWFARGKWDVGTIIADYRNTLYDQRHFSVWNRYSNQECLQVITFTEQKVKLYWHVCALKFPVSNEHRSTFLIRFSALL